MTTVFSFSKLRRKKNAGFTLIEIAVSLVVIAIILAGIMGPITNQILLKNVNDTQRYINDATETLHGFLVANRRLPCPASAGSLGVESFATGNATTGGTCTNPYDGFLPAVTLGLQSADGSGYGIDPWGNRIRYAVTTSNTSAFTKRDSIQTIGMTALTPDLRVCSTAIGATATACAVGAELAQSAVIVIYSVGPNGRTGGGGIDEGQNPNPLGGSADQVFVFHQTTIAAAANGAFDDIFAYVSPFTIYARMISANLLP